MDGVMVVRAWKRLTGADLESGFWEQVVTV